MSTISSFLTTDHRACDEEFADMENAVASGDWDLSAEKLNKFIKRESSSLLIQII